VVVLTGYPLRRRSVRVRQVYTDMAVGGDAFTAGVDDDTLPARLQHLGFFTEDQVIERP
jgi:hypothetical protein